MTPEQHYEQAEAFAKRAATTHGAAANAANTFAILAVAHALLSLRGKLSVPRRPETTEPQPQNIPLL